MDMVGRLRDKMTIHGVGSSNQWRTIIQKANVPVRLNLNLQNDSHIPTDTTSFYSKGIPILSAFTGLHDDYHSPTDTPDKLNYEGIEKCAQLFSRIITSIPSTELIKYASQEAPASTNRSKLRAYLGTIPNYSQTDQKGVLLSGIAQNGPADSAGIKSGDVIVELQGLKVENIYDYTDAIGKLQAGKKTKINILREGMLIELFIIPKSR
jgi:C-terminal processing protease CtpA/Prc